MRYERLSGSAINEYSNLIPRELYARINSDDSRVLGVRLFNEPCGALVWEKDPSSDTGRLLSIYVDPPCRRIGAGSRLLEAVAGEMSEEGVKELELGFAVTGDRSMLVPFFEDMDVETEILEFPMGTQTLRDVIASLEKKGLDMAKPCGKAVHELEPNEKNIVGKWLSETFSEDLKSFELEAPPSFVSIEDGEIRSALLFGQEAYGVLGLDYVYMRDTKSMMGLFNLAADRMSELYPANTLIEIMLTNPKAVSLYTALFGEPDERIGVCSGRIKAAL